MIPFVKTLWTSINNRFNESVTNRAEHGFLKIFLIIHLIILRYTWYVRHQMRFLLFLWLSVLDILYVFKCGLCWPTDDSAVKNRTWRRNLKPGPFKILYKLIFVPECCKIECLPDAYWTARALLKTRCARLKTDSWSNNFFKIDKR